MASCPHCGIQLVAGGQFCHNCGASVSPTTAAATDALQSAVPPAAKPRGGKRTVIIGVVVGLVVVLGGVGTYLAIGRSSHTDGLALGACVVGQWRLTDVENFSYGQWQSAITPEEQGYRGQELMTFTADDTFDLLVPFPIKYYGTYAIEGNILTLYPHNQQVTSMTVTCTRDTLVFTDSGGGLRQTFARAVDCATGTGGPAPTAGSGSPAPTTGDLGGGSAAPRQLVGQITDDVSALASRLNEVRAALDCLRGTATVQLYVVFVASFGPYSAQAWLTDTAQLSGLGHGDALLVVATADRSYAWELDKSIPLTQQQADEVEAIAIKPALQTGNWAGAVIGAADGLAAALTGQPVQAKP
jgi:hypothetical protein